MSCLVLGVDGGGTKTIARIMQTHPSGALCVLGEGAAGGSNPLSVGSDSARREIDAAVRSACAAAGLGEGDSAEAAVLAVAGCGTASVAADLQAWADSVGFAARVRVIDDTRPLIASIADEEPAIGVIAGTGSSAVARPAGGGALLVGGWGYAIDDAGSGYDLGRACLRRLCHAIDAASVSETELTRAAQELAGTGDPQTLKRAVYGAPSPRGVVARYAVPVLTLARRGDAEAAAIAAAGAEALALLVESAWRRIGSPDFPRPAVRFSGGLLERSSYYRGLLTERLVGLGWSGERLAMAPDAATGCGLLAARWVAGTEKSAG